MSDPPSSIQPLSNQPPPAQLSESEKKRRKQNVARSKRFRQNATNDIINGQLTGRANPSLVYGENMINIQNNERCENFINFARI